MHVLVAGARGLMQPLLYGVQAHTSPISLFHLPAVRAVVDFKWQAWAYKFLLGELALFLVRVFLF